MRKLLLLVALVFTSVYCSAITVDEIINKYKKAKGADCHEIGKEICNAKAGKALSSVEGLYIIALGDSPEKVKKEFATDFRSIKDDKYDTTIKVKEDGDNVRIMNTKDGVTPASMVIFVIDDEESIIVKIAGKIDVSNLSELTGINL